MYNSVPHASVELSKKMKSRCADFLGSSASRREREAAKCGDHSWIKFHLLREEPDLTV